MEPESTGWETEVSYRAVGVRHRPLCEAKDGNDPRLSTVKGLPLVWVFAVALGLMASSTIVLASPAEGPTEVCFELYLGYTIVAKGSMGRLQKLNFIIDTGAVPSVVDARVAPRLGLKGTFDTVSVFSKDVRTEEVVVPTVDLGPVHAESVRFLAQDLRFIGKPTRRPNRCHHRVRRAGRARLQYRLSIEANRVRIADGRGQLTHGR